MQNQLFGIVPLRINSKGAGCLFFKGQEPSADDPVSLFKGGSKQRVREGLCGPMGYSKQKTV